MLRIENLRKRYRTGDEALKGVSFAVSSGQMTGLIGPSGAGKSTLIRCVNRLVEPTGGRIFLEDLEVTALSRSELRKTRRRIGMIFQEFALVERLTVMENVLSGRLGYVPFWRSFTRRYPPADIDKAFALLERVDMLDQADKRADALSGGQRQRVGVARALEQDPELLLIDEPTASLDPKTSRQIMRLIREICAERNLPAIINIHDVVLAQAFVDRILGLRAGEVVFDGLPSALSPEILTRIYGEEDWTALHSRQDREADDERSAREAIDGELERRISLS